MQYALTIDKEFHSLIPPLSEQEFAQLEANILADGCRDPLVIWKNHNETIIDGHNRFKICKKHGLDFSTEELAFHSREAAIEWIILNQFGRRNITLFVRGELALRLEPIIAAKAKRAQIEGGKNKVVQKSSQPTEERKTRTQVANLAGLSHDSLSKAKLVSLYADEATKQELRSSKDKSLNRVAKEIKETKQREKREEKRQQSILQAAPMNQSIVIGDFREEAHRIADGSVSLIFTDPPYDRDAEELFTGLAEFAARKLCDGGSLIMYLGHLQLPAAFDAFRGRLRHWWTCACLHSSKTVLMREYGIRALWKPMLWFVKGTRDDKSTVVHDVVSGGAEKSHHDWQQAESEAEYWIGNLCPPAGLVCDPFLGGGTTAAACKKLGRLWVGFEIDATAAKGASQRLDD